MKKTIVTLKYCDPVAGRGTSFWGFEEAYAVGGKDAVIELISEDLSFFLKDVSVEVEIVE